MPKFEKCIDCGNPKIIHHPDTNRLFYCPKCRVVFSLQVYSGESYSNKFWEDKE